MDINKSFDFSSFVSANPGRRVSGFDYIHSIYKAQSIDGDFLVWIARLFWPEFKIVDGRVFVATLFEDTRYRTLIENHTTAGSPQFWTNLLEITGIFDELSYVQAKELADVLAHTWNSKLSIEFGEVLSQARVVEDELSGEVFITIDSDDK